VADVRRGHALFFAAARNPAQSLHRLAGLVHSRVERACIGGPASRRARVAIACEGERVTATSSFFQHNVPPGS